MRGDRGATVKVTTGAGLIKLRTTTLNQHDEAVLVYVVNMVVQRRSEAGEALRHLTEDRPFGKVVLAG